MPSLIPLDNAFGAAFLGLIISVGIYGVTLLQAYMYYVDFSSKDRKPLKIFVALLLGLDTVHVALVTHALYWCMVTNFGDYNALAIVVWSLEVQVVIADLLAASVEGFFAWRVYMLSSKHNWWIPAIIVLTALGMLVSGFGFMVHGLHNSRSGLDTALPWTTLGLTCQLVCDATIMASMTYYLLQGRRTGFANTHTIVNTLIMYTLNTGLLTALFAALTLVFASGEANPACSAHSM